MSLSFDADAWDTMSPFRAMPQPSLRCHIFFFTACCCCALEFMRNVTKLQTHTKHIVLDGGCAVKMSDAGRKRILKFSQSSSRVECIFSHTRAIQEVTHSTLTVCITWELLERPPGHLWPMRTRRSWPSGMSQNNLLLLLLVACGTCGRSVSQAL